jgi:hypothetical protein
MKNIFTYLILAFVILIPFNVFSQTINVWNITQNLFSYSRLEKDLNSDSRNAASVTYKGKIFYFISYDKDHQVVVREIVNDSLSLNSFYPTEVAHYEILKDRVEPRSQLAPVVFKGVLYLFFNDDSGYFTGKVGYVTYDDKLEKWSAPIMYPESEGLKIDAGSAVVVDNKLCLIFHYFTSWWEFHNGSNYGTEIVDYDDIISVTTDPTDLNGWGSYRINIMPEFYVKTGDQGEKTRIYTPISAISQNYLNEAGITSQKLMVATILPNNSNYINISQYYFNSDGYLVDLRSDSVDCHVIPQSVTLVQGSVANDLTSVGNCVQMFVKNEIKDNSDFNRYRILRLQLKEGETKWTTQEENVLPQNSPMKMWADQETNLTAVNYEVQDNSYPKTRTQRYIVLLYRGNTDNNHPLLSAWVKSDQLIYNKNHTQDLADDHSQRQYVGYIEGPPPFHKNTPNTSYINASAARISELQFTSAKSEEIDQKVAIETKYSMTAHISAVSAEIGYLYGTTTATDTLTTQTDEFNVFSWEENHGYYLYQAPTITLAEYYVWDWTQKNKQLYSSFNFSIATLLHIESVELGDSLNSSIPQTFMSENRQIDFSNYFSIVPSKAENLLSWAPGMDHSTEIAIETGSEVSNTTKKSVKLSAELGHYFSSELEKTIEYEVTTKTYAKNSIKSNTRLNEPQKGVDGDCTYLEYYTYWIRPSKGASNWWVKNPNDNTWCVTYQVKTIAFQNGDTIKDTSKYANSRPRQDTTASINLKPVVENPKIAEQEQIEAGKSPLDQNNPNPFIGSTKIKYTVGIENMPANSTDCLTRLVIYNLSGQQVATLVNENKAPGTYEVEWDASQFTPGVYFYSLQSGSFKDVKKMVLLK